MDRRIASSPRRARASVTRRQAARRAQAYFESSSGLVDFMFTCELTHKFRGGIGAPMEHKGVEYSVVQTTNPVGWRWIVYLPGRPPKTGTSPNREIALRLH
jgi:hypothetical protein